MSEKLKPVIFVKGNYNYHGQNDFQQKLLLQALKVTTDPNELKTMIGVKTVAQVYRTLDKLALRKEYHQVLAEEGLDLNTIVRGIKNVVNTTEKDDIKLKGYQGLLKSLGLDEYKEPIEDSGNTWEDVLLEHLDKEKADGTKQIEGKKFEEYEVIVPEIPEGELEKINVEKELGRSLYE